MLLNTIESAAALSGGNSDLDEIEILDKELLNYFKDKFLVEPALSRTLVSFQANKTRPVYRWYKYKEAFSASLVEYLLDRYGITEIQRLKNG